MSSSSLVVFEVGGVRAAVQAAEVIEVVAVRDPTTVPAAPAFLAGLFAHRGAVVALVDGAERLAPEGLTRSGGRWSGTTILLQSSLGPIGLAVDRVVDVEGEGAAVERLDVEALVRGCREALQPR